MGESIHSWIFLLYLCFLSNWLLFMYFFRNGNWQLVKPCYHFCVWLKPVHLEPSTAQTENVSIVNFCAMVKTIAVMDQMNLTAPAIVNFIWNHLVISLVSWKKNRFFIHKIWYFRGFFAILATFCQFLATFGMVFFIGSDELNCSSNCLFHLKWYQVERILFFWPNRVFFRGFAILNTSGLFLPLLGIFCECLFDLM